MSQMKQAAALATILFCVGCSTGGNFHFPSAEDALLGRNPNEMVLPIDEETGECSEKVIEVVSSTEIRFHGQPGDAIHYSINGGSERPFDVTNQMVQVAFLAPHNDTVEVTFRASGDVGKSSSCSIKVRSESKD